MYVSTCLLVSHNVLIKVFKNQQIFFQSEIHAFSTTQNCIDEVIKLVKEKRHELSTEFFLSNKEINDSLLEMCEFFVPHKIHKVLKLVDKETCKDEIPTSSELEEGIYIIYLQLLNELKVYVGVDVSIFLFSINNITV